jgi:hypothetical protein
MMDLFYIISIILVMISPLQVQAQRAKAEGERASEEEQRQFITTKNIFTWGGKEEEEVKEILKSLRKKRRNWAGKRCFRLLICKHLLFIL